MQLVSTFDQESKKNPKEIFLKEIDSQKYEYEDVTKSACKNDFENKKSWPLFKSIVTKKNPIVYRYKKDGKEMEEHLFCYSYQLFDLIRNLIEELRCLYQNSFKKTDKSAIVAEMIKGDYNYLNKLLLGIDKNFNTP